MTEQSTDSRSNAGHTVSSRLPLTINQSINQPSVLCGNGRRTAITEQREILSLPFSVLLEAICRLYQFVQYVPVFSVSFCSKKVILIDFDDASLCFLQPSNSFQHQNQTQAKASVFLFKTTLNIFMG